MCAVLDLSDTNMALKGIPEKHKAKQSLGLRGRAPWVITEAGLYRLVMRSNKPEAAEFQDWVTDVVLPTIRKTGGFMTPEVAQAAIDDPAVLMAKALIMAHESLKASAARVAVLLRTARSLGFVATAD